MMLHTYKKRYEIFCNKLLLERQYCAACFMTTSCVEERMYYDFPNEALSFTKFTVSMLGAAITHFAERRGH